MQPDEHDEVLDEWMTSRSRAARTGYLALRTLRDGEHYGGPPHLARSRLTAGPPAAVSRHRPGFFLGCGSGGGEPSQPRPRPSGGAT